MQTIKAFEFKDLTPKQKKEMLEKNKENVVRWRLEMLAENVGKGRIEEKEYYKALGCSKHYAETTGWFVPACYYDKNKESVDKEATRMAKDGLYTETGRYIQAR